MEKNPTLLILEAFNVKLLDSPQEAFNYFEMYCSLQMNRISIDYFSEEAIKDFLESIKQ